MKRWLALLGFGLLILSFLFVFHGDAVQAHYCDDHYASQAERENCWWRYWNDQVTPNDTRLAALPAPEMPAALSSFFCDTYYTLQASKENCWWRYHNNQLLPHERNAMSAPPPMIEEKAKQDLDMMDQAPPDTPDGLADTTNGSDMMEEVPVGTVVPQGVSSDFGLDAGSMDPEAMAEASRKRYCNSLDLQAAKENCWWHLQNNQEIGWPRDLGYPDNSVLTFYALAATSGLPLVLNQNLGGFVIPVVNGQELAPVWAWGYSPFPIYEWPVHSIHDLAILADLRSLGTPAETEIPLVPHVCIKPDRADTVWICILDKDM